MLAMIPVTIHVSDTYFIVAHIHYVLYGGSLFTIYAGVYYWFPKMTGRMYDETLGRLHFWLTFVAFNATFAPMHLIGVAGHAAARGRLPRAVRRLEPVHLPGQLRPRLLDADLRLQHRPLVAHRRARGGEPVAGAHAGVAGLLARRRSSTSTACPTVVGGPYEYGVPGAVHGIFQPAGQEAKTPQTGRRRGRREQPRVRTGAWLRS